MEIVKVYMQKLVFYRTDRKNVIIKSLFFLLTAIMHIQQKLSKSKLQPNVMDVKKKKSNNAMQSPFLSQIKLKKNKFCTDFPLATGAAKP